MEKKFSRILSVVLSVLMLITVIPLSASAATVVAEGECGENLTWSLDSEGTFTVSGTGEMWENEEEWSDEQYYDYREHIKQYGEQIKKIIVNDGVTTIAAKVFGGCKNLTSVSLSDSVTEIQEQAFASCPKLTSIILPQSLERIYSMAFLNTPVKTLNIPANVKSIKGSVVLHADFEGYTVDKNNENFCTDENGNLFNKDKTKIIHHVFNSEEKEYTIPDTVTTIGDYAFGFNLFLEKVNIPDTVKSIEEGAFACCFALKELNYPRNLEEMACSSIMMLDVAVKKLALPENAVIDCNEHIYETEQGPVEENHYEYIFRDLAVCALLEELTVYDRDMDFTDVCAGFYIEDNFHGALTEQGLEVYESFYLKYIADVYAYYYFGYGEEPTAFEFNTEEFVDKSVEPDLIITDVWGYTESFYKIPGFTVRCYPGSTAEEYAKKYDFNIKYICDEHTEEIIPAVLPTCTETGLTEGKKCSVCDEILKEQITVEANGHDYETVVTAPTCTEQGFTTYICECGDSYVADYVAENGHYYESEITEEPSCKEKGTKVYECVCGDTYIESIPAIGHKDSDDNNVCDNCGVGVCDHMCHKSGFIGFIWKIINFFGKLFGSNPVCECGMAHY